MPRKKTTQEVAVIDVGPKAHHDELTIARALVSSRGKITQAATMLGIAYATLKRAIDKSPLLQGTLDEIRESTLDAAETILEKRALADEDGSALAFLLKTQGKDRGYGDELTVKVEQTSTRQALEGVMSRLSDSALAEVLAALEEET